MSLHGLLLGTLFFSAAFGTHPDETQLEVLTMVPQNLLDAPNSGASGAARSVQAARQSAPAPAPMARSESVVRPQRIVRPEPSPVEPVEQPRHHERVEEDQPVARSEDALLPAPRVTHKHHEIRPTFTPASRSSRVRVSRRPEPAEAQAESQAEAQRSSQIERALSQMASGVERSGATGSLVDVRGIGASGGGASFANYRQAIFTIYYNAWLTPDDASSRLASVDARIVVARDGTIISAEVLSRSGDAGVDHSVRRALDSVTKLPPFPAEARDEQRTFVIRFNLQSKESSG